MCIHCLMKLKDSKMHSYDFGPIISRGICFTHMKILLAEITEYPSISCEDTDIRDVILAVNRIKREMSDYFGLIISQGVLKTGNQSA